MCLLMRMYECSVFVGLSAIRNASRRFFDDQGETFEWNIWIAGSILFRRTSRFHQLQTVQHRCEFAGKLFFYCPPFFFSILLDRFDDGEIVDVFRKQDDRLSSEMQRLDRRRQMAYEGGRQ